jgi:adenine phosphoribosyltransferase
LAPQRDLYAGHADGGFSVIDREQIVTRLQERVRSIPDFPVEGILFRDITPILQDPGTYRAAIELFVEHFRARDVDVFAGIESRGFLFAAPVALELGASFVPVRKVGKLPADKIARTYALEYGEATLEMHRDAVEPHQRVVIVDDLLATGGTARAACEMVEELGGEILEVAFLIELAALKGRDQIPGQSVTSFLCY